MKNKINKNIGKIYCITGKFASGKSTVINLLCNEYGYNKIITCTTREKRDGEREGIDYYFLTNEQFTYYEKKNELVAINNFYNKNNEIIKRYGILTSKIDFSEKAILCPCEPNGYKDLLNKYGKDIVKCIYLNISDKERFLRVINREINPNMYNYCLRYLEETEIYKDFENIVDIITDNTGSSDIAAQKIHEYIQLNISKI